MHVALSKGRYKCTVPKDMVDRNKADSGLGAKEAKERGDGIL